MEMKVIKREFYLKKILPYVNKPVIKIITGIRRCGKSFFIKQIIDELSSKGIVDKQIVYINKELIKFDFIKDYHQLYTYAIEKFEGVLDNKYLFIDEVQEIEEWERAIVSFFAEGDFDIYITGSNANLLSSEIATLISGRYVELTIQPLDFQEFIRFRDIKNPNLDAEFKSYLKYGGFPVIHYFDYNEELTYQYIQSLYNTILLKDIVSRYNIRNVQLFENIIKYVFDNIGNIFSGRSIAKYLKSQNLNIGLDTLQNYLSYLEATFLIYKIKRYDLKGKRLLEIYEKYYLSDIAFKNAITGFKANDIGGMLENVVFLRLKQLGYEVSIGKLGDREIDFIAQQSGNKIYIQVAYLLETEATIEREFGVLKLIKDNYPKYVLTMDKLPLSNSEGIVRMNIIDFLLNFE
jgi:predicted AAA+ superfamily ATPase